MEELGFVHTVESGWEASLVYLIHNCIMICEGRWRIATGLLVTLFHGSVVNEGKAADIRKT